MNDKLLFAVLQLDSIINVLSWSERTRIHLYRAEKYDQLTPNIIYLYGWIRQNGWTAPEMRYGQDRLLYYWWKNDWHPIEELAEQLKQNIK